MKSSISKPLFWKLILFSKKTAPLSISSRGAVLFFRPNLRERRMEKTVAASVELITAPIGCKSVILASAKQTKHQEEEQNRNSELPGKLVEEYANDDNS